MSTYHIHIGGLVQGVGFRPLVSRLAGEMGMEGWVSNSTDGVHIEFNAAGREKAEAFYDRICSQPPANATISRHHMEETAARDFSGFHIRQSRGGAKPDLLLPPDIALCERCRREIKDKQNRRYRYPFTTCLECGPRYSIMTALPYDREHTAMSGLSLCPGCEAEYNDMHDPRHYSQTNSCKDCPIPMHLFEAGGKAISLGGEEIFSFVRQVLEEGRIVAIKGIGGYLLICDATNKEAIVTLRKRKHRPQKPFALLYPGLEMAEADMVLRPVEMQALGSKTAPVVLCPLRQVPGNAICKETIAPGLDRIGLMLPYSPLLQLIAGDFGKPLVATSGNISGSPILYKDEDAMAGLSEVADYLLMYDRAIVTPQDDSVVVFTADERSIILRRSRGMAPGYYPSPFTIGAGNEGEAPALQEGTVLAMGGELKSAFALLDGDKCYVSQYLGDQESLEAQASFRDTLSHLLQLLQIKPGHILIDQHPGYYISRMGETLAGVYSAQLMPVQHHKAHFAAVLAENGLLSAQEPVLGIIWDGAGYGEDEQIWGGEVFIYAQKEMDRAAFVDYFPQLLGDKMSREPRLSALALLKCLPDRLHLAKAWFSAKEWQYYRQLLDQPHYLFTSSMGRLLDGMAALLGIAGHNSYEGEAVMRMEALARTCDQKTCDRDRDTFYHFPLVNDRLDWRPLLDDLLDDRQRGTALNTIARRLFCSLARAVVRISDHFEIDRIAFSGGVFQNSLLVEMITCLAAGKKELFFHRKLSPNDECIGFGQLAYFQLHLEARPVPGFEREIELLHESYK